MRQSFDGARLRRLTLALRQAEEPIRILRTIAWPAAVRERFLAAGGGSMPEVTYQPPQIDGTLRGIDQLRRELEAGPVDAWLGRQCDAIEHSARMLSAVGTPAFFEHSKRLYGTPSDPSVDPGTRVLDLARHLETLLHEVGSIDFGAPAPACHLATAVAAAMESAVREHFGDEAPAVEIVDELSSNAIAGPRRIRIRRHACFTDLDIKQLVHHEALIHVATSLNGRHQTDLPILASSHAGTTRTQEGLAVFAELISGSIDLDRLHRLARRVHAIQMAIDGADFLDVYRYFEAEGVDAEQSFESARRVFRGGVLTGGAPFTKDAVYLDGLLRVHTFLRTIVSHGRVDLLRLLFCGKLDLEDVPVLATLQRAGLCRPARYLPPWAADLRFLVAYLGMSAFWNRIDLAGVRRSYEETLAAIPRLDC